MLFRRIRAGRLLPTFAIFELASTAPLGDPRVLSALVSRNFLFFVAGAYIFVELPGKLILLQDAFRVVRFAWCGD